MDEEDERMSKNTANEAPSSSDTMESGRMKHATSYIHKRKPEEITIRCHPPHFNNTATSHTNELVEATGELVPSRYAYRRSGGSRSTANPGSGGAHRISGRPTQAAAEMRLLQHKLGALSNARDVPTDEFGDGGDGGLDQDVTYWMAKRLKYEPLRGNSPKSDLPWKKLFPPTNTGGRVNQKRKRAVAKLDRRQILQCLTCNHVELGGYKFGDYVICKSCGNNDFVSVREWSPTRDGNSHNLRNAAFSNSDGE